MKLLNGIVSIERDYLKQYMEDLVIDYEHIYKTQFDDRLCKLSSSLHYKLVENLNILNDSINGNKHFWADPSRDLIKAISLTKRFIKNLNNAGEKVCLNQYYEEVLNKCNEFLSASGGSSVPDDMNEVEIFYEIPIFEIPDMVNFKNDSSKKYHLQPVGSGSYARVYRYLDENYNKTFALKRAHETISQKDLERFYLEFETMKLLSSPYVLEVYSIDKVKNEYVMEYADTTLFEYISVHNQDLDFNARRILCNQIIKGFEYLSKKNILHRDIAPNNILLKKYEDTIIIKIADFGNAKIPERLLTSFSTEIRGYFNDHTGLQRVGFSNYDFRFESFALSKLLYFILTGKHKDFTKFDYHNLREFMDRGINPDFEKRFNNIGELKLEFYKIKPI